MEGNREDFKFRFLDTKDDFWNYVSTQDATPSEIIRHFIKQGVSGKNGLTIAQYSELKEEITAIRRQHANIGGNLNQLARYFNSNDYLVESELYENHKDIVVTQKEITKLLNEILKLL